MKNSISLYKEILTSDQKIIIPEYQREYSWGKDDIGVFLEDIQKNIENKNIHYLGTIYIYEPEGKKEIHIIDGQQRLTTTIIFLYTIMEKLLEKEDADFLYLKDGMNKLISDNKTLNDAYQISFYGNDPDVYEDDIRNNLIEENINTVYNLLSNLEEEELLEIYEVLKESVRVNLVSVNELKDAMNIFMNLNARGKELSAIEIIKANIFSYILDIDYDESYLLALKKKFNKLIYHTEADSYNENLRNFKKNLFLYASYKDNAIVQGAGLKEGTSDKIFSSVFMKVLLNNFDFTTLIGINDFINEFEQFTNTYIWWNLKMIKSYKPTDTEKMYKEEYKDINKAKTTDIATLISFSDIENYKEEGYKKVLEAFSIIELKKIYNKHILKMENTKINLAGIENKMSSIIKSLNDNDLESFISIFDCQDFTFERSKVDELVNFINMNGIIDSKDSKVTKAAITNVKNSGMLI